MAGTRGPAQSGPLLEARQLPPPPAATIEDRSDAQHVRWLVIRRKKRLPSFTDICIVLFVFMLAAIFSAKAISDRSIGWAILAVVLAIGSIALVYGVVASLSRYQEIFLDEQGLTVHPGAPSRNTTSLTRLIPLEAIQFFQDESEGYYGDYHSHVRVYGDGTDWLLGSGLGYAPLEMVWVAHYLASGCALLLGTETEHFLVARPDPPEPNNHRSGPSTPSDAGSRT